MPSGVRLTVSQNTVQEIPGEWPATTRQAWWREAAPAVNIVTKSGSDALLRGALLPLSRNSAMDARDPFAFSQALAPGAVFDPPHRIPTGSPSPTPSHAISSAATSSFPIHKSFGNVRLPRLRRPAPKFPERRTTADEHRYFSSDRRSERRYRCALKHATPVPCLNNPNGTVIRPCLPRLPVRSSTALTVSQFTGLTPGQSAINGFLVNELESNGGLFNYNTRQYLFNGRLDHHISEVDSITLSYRYGHDLEETRRAVADGLFCGRLDPQL